MHGEVLVSANLEPKVKSGDDRDGNMHLHPLFWYTKTGQGAMSKLAGLASGHLVYHTNVVLLLAS